MVGEIDALASARSAAEPKAGASDEETRQADDDRGDHCASRNRLAMRTVRRTIVTSVPMQMSAIAI